MNEVKGPPVFIAIDPGHTSGWALFDTADGTFASGEVEGRRLLYRFIEGIIEDGRPAHLVVEQFDIGEETTENTRQLDAVFILGALEYVAAKLGLGFTVQQRAAAKTFSHDAKLKALGWWFRGGEGHANDAARHLLAWMVDTRASGSGPLMRRLLEALG